MKSAATPSVSDSADGGMVASVEKPARPLRILVVDDEPAMRTVIAAGLHGDGHDVETANDGSSAVSLHSQRPFDLIVADLFMPGMSGRELASAIKRQSPGTPVICVTGHHEKLEKSPFEMVIRKPFPHSVLCATVKLFSARLS